MRKVGDGEKRKRKRKEKKITAEIVATNVVASQPPNGDRLQRRPLVPIVAEVQLKASQIKTWTCCHTNMKKL